MKKTAVALVFCSFLLPATAAHADTSSLKSGFESKSDFQSQDEIDKRNAAKAKNYVSAEYVRSQMLTRYVIQYDECVAAGNLPAGAVSAETKFNLYVDREKARPDINRPVDLVSDQDIADSLHKSLEDSRKKLQSIKFLHDADHCHSVANVWPIIEKKYGLGDDDR